MALDMFIPQRVQRWCLVVRPWFMVYTCAAWHVKCGVRLRKWLLATGMHSNPTNGPHASGLPKVRTQTRRRRNVESSAMALLELLEHLPAGQLTISSQSMLLTSPQSYSSSGTSTDSPSCWLHW